VRAGDRFVCAGPAGGGYGNPHERPADKVLADVLDGLITAEIAARDFGVAIAGSTVDAAKTAALRARR
jgi:N-methylhydantoinase B